MSGHLTRRLLPEEEEILRKRADAQYNLGCAYANGQGVQEDHVLAYAHFNLAASNTSGEDQARCNKARDYAAKALTRQQLTEAVKWFRKWADEGNADAQHALGCAYANGEGVAQDYNEAVKWHHKAADQGHASSQHALAYAYRYGKGVPKNWVSAYMWYALAVAYSSGKDQARRVKLRDFVAGQLQSQQLAVAERLAQEWEPHEEIRGTFDQPELLSEDGAFKDDASNSDKMARGRPLPAWCPSTLSVRIPVVLLAALIIIALLWYRPAFNTSTSAQRPAEATNAQTETTERAQAASKVDTAEKSASEAPPPTTLELYQAATKGDPTALRGLRTKAENGDSVMQFTLGYMYENGQGVPKDLAQAVAWYSRAAEQGNAYSQHNLGVMYRDGEGVPEDAVQAVVWFRKAADRGLPEAQFNLGVMYHNGQGVPQDLAQAEAWYRKAAQQGNADAQKQLKVLAEAKPKTFRVPLKRQNGVLYVPVLINDTIPLDFIIDSGAADVQVPVDVVSTLMRTGTLIASDFTGTNTYVLADGSMVPSQTFRIRSLKVGNWALENVSGNVGSSNGSLLLGQSFLNRFKSWSIDNARQVLVLSY